MKQSLKRFVLLFLLINLLQTEIPAYNLAPRHFLYGALSGIAISFSVFAHKISRKIKHFQNKLERNTLFNNFYVSHGNYLSLCIKKNTSESKRSKRTLVLYLHGFGGHKNEVGRLFGREEIRFPQHADYIIPCFEFTNHTDKERAPLFNTDFGQNQDILTALTSIKHFFLSAKNAYEKLLVIGRSRGSCIAAILIGVLSTPEHPLLKDAHISEEERICIVDAISNGGIIFITPLVSLKAALIEIFGYALGSLIYHTPLIKAITNTSYHRSSPLNPLTMIKKWNKDKIPAIVIFATEDNVVGSTCNEEFIKQLELYNDTPSTSIYVPGHHSTEELHKINVRTLDVLLQNQITNLPIIFPSFTKL